MTAQPRDVVEVLAKHQQAYDSTGGYRGILGGWSVRCACGWHGVDHGEGGPRLIFQHQAAMLTAEGYPVTAAGLAEVRAEGVRQEQERVERAMDRWVDGDDDTEEGPMTGETVTTAAKAEAERRWPQAAAESLTTPLRWLNEGMADGFVLGAQWAADRPDVPMSESSGQGDDPIPRYAQLDVWMALFGADRSQEYEAFRDEHGFAETWARLCDEVRTQAARPVEAVDREALPHREVLADLILTATYPFRGPGGQTLPHVMPVHYAIADAVLAHLATLGDATPSVTREQVEAARVAVEQEMADDWRVTVAYPKSVALTAVAAVLAALGIEVQS